MSSDNPDEKSGGRKSKVSSAMLINGGLGEPKPRPKGVGDGEPVNIQALQKVRLTIRVTQEARLAREWKCASKPLAPSILGVRGVRELNLRSEQTN